MTDTFVPVTAGSGTNIDTRIPSGGEHRQVVVIGDGATVAQIAEVLNLALAVRPVRSATATLSNVNDAAADTTLLASNANRIKATFYNDSTSTLYLKFGTGATTTSFTVKLGPEGYFELPTDVVYTGQINGIWSSDSTGAVRITELT